MNMDSSSTPEMETHFVSCAQQTQTYCVADGYQRPWDTTGLVFKVLSHNLLCPKMEKDHRRKPAHAHVNSTGRAEDAWIHLAVMDFLFVSIIKISTSRSLEELHQLLLVYMCASIIYSLLQTLLVLPWALLIHSQVKVCTDGLALLQHFLFFLSLFCVLCFGSATYLMFSVGFFLLLSAATSLWTLGTLSSNLTSEDGVPSCKRLTATWNGMKAFGASACFKARGREGGTGARGNGIFDWEWRWPANKSCDVGKEKDCLKSSARCNVDIIKVRV